ncbi:hypothetical protein [Botrimarina hoheduenensis]|uniref:Endonuclease/Exonuclease/phosphatase family protein n=1 Tax=Botrimarina hoheduenensis TaxID=2528000 RepID=A0A5C5W018_9BACT|nr:hypothetical protein [Botrimarina hoheduenensis]TWT43361.1 hypothetical protein Pla111_23120 [Botrimarina hoheduenensis]
MIGRYAFFLVAALAFTSSAFAQLRVVTYNTLDKPFDATDETELRTIFGAIATTPVNGIAKRPDIIGLQEQRTFTFVGGDFDSTGRRIADELNDLFGVSTYQVRRVGTGADLLMYVYDTSTVSLVATQQVFSTAPRATLRGQFQPVGYTSPDATLYTYNSHFKAGSTGSDQSDRNAEATAIRNNSNSLGSQVNALYMGDMNIGSSFEAAYTTLRAAGNGQAFDPLGLSSWPNVTVASHLTQSTRSGSIGDGGAGGGMDDRFDLQLTTDDLLDGEGLSYLGPTSIGLSGLEHSMKAFGNDGVSYNQSINNTFVGRSQPASVLNALFNFSDHLPVVADYQLPAVMEVLHDTIPATLQLGESFSFDLTVRNAADVVAVLGADELDYALAGTGAASGGGAGFELALSPGSTYSISLDTSSPGAKTGSVVVSSTSQGAENALTVIPLAYEVIGVPVVAGDFSGDGRVDNEDLNLLLVNWGGPVPPVPAGWTGDQPLGSEIDNDELNRLLLNWGFGTATSIPEPATGLLLALAACALAGRAAPQRT